MEDEPVTLRHMRDALAVVAAGVMGARVLGDLRMSCPAREIGSYALGSSPHQGSVTTMV
jgi:hypothetical protein